VDLRSRRDADSTGQSARLKHLIRAEKAEGLRTHFGGGDAIFFLLQIFGNTGSGALRLLIVSFVIIGAHPFHTQKTTFQQIA
jgi:hypothetical protein